MILTRFNKDLHRFMYGPMTKKEWQHILKLLDSPKLYTTPLLPQIDNGDDLDAPQNI